MITIFNRRSCYIGFDLAAFNRTREILERNHIPYKYKTRSQSGPSTPQGAVMGGLAGHDGQAAGMFVQYEIFVHKQDEEKARFLIKQSHNS